MGLGRALRLTARDRALSQPCRRQVRPASRHPVQEPRDRRALPGGNAQLGRYPGGWQALPHPTADYRYWRALGADHAAHRRRRYVLGPVLPHPLLAEGAGDLRGQARRGDRHRCQRCADDPGSGQDRRPSDRVPAHPQLVRAIAQRQDRRGGDVRDPSPLSRDLRAL